MTSDQFRQMAMMHAGSTEAPHFDRTSFRVKNKIYATMMEKEHLVCLMLTPEDQDIFVTLGKPAVYPVPNKWGEKGATYVRLHEASPLLLEDALLVAYSKKKG